MVIGRYLWLKTTRYGLHLWLPGAVSNCMVTKGLGFTWQQASAANAVFSDVDTPQKIEADVIVDDETSPEHVYVPVNLWILN